MSARRELATFGVVLGLLVAGFFAETLVGGKVLSPADVLFASASFRDEHHGPGYEPKNRLLIDPVLQFQPWLEFNRAMLRRGRLPLWNNLAGCGVPHLANGQSAPFDPFHLIAYLGPLPQAYARMAVARLWVAGLGMFLLAWLWGLGPWGRWFCGLTFPFCGFLVLWLLFPVTNVAVWMPWLFWASDRALERPGGRRLGALALVSGFTVLGGHIQTSAHVLLAAGLYVLWRLAGARRGLPRPTLGGLGAWSGGVMLGLTLASVTIVPLAVYLSRSPVWGDRQREGVSPWKVTSPRALDAVCTVIPYAYGSQRRGHPNLARALGVHNLNESAGGYAGLATLVWLAPQAWRARRHRPRVMFLAGLTVIGFLGAFGFAPVANILRAAPVLDVTDQRRLTLWVAFGLVLLGGIGLDHLPRRWPRGVARWSVGLWVSGGLALAVGALALPGAEPWLRRRAGRHYAEAAAMAEGANAAVYHARAERQVRAAVSFLPAVYGLAAGELAAMAALAALLGRERVSWTSARWGLAGLTLAEVFAVGVGVNPAIEPWEDRPESAVVARLRAVAGDGGRILGLGEEFPPNVAMRFGLADPRNYDSVEMTRSLDWLEPLYGDERIGKARTSRRPVTWEGVLRSRERLREASVAAVVSAARPLGPLTDRAERVGDVWVTRLPAAPVVSTASGGFVSRVERSPGRMRIWSDLHEGGPLVIRETFDPGWRAEVDGRPARVEPYRGTFMAVRPGAGPHVVSLAYDPPEVRVACALSVAAVVAVLAAFLSQGFARSGTPEIRSKVLDGPEPSG
jgi:hypothetical protein